MLSARHREGLFAVEGLACLRILLAASRYRLQWLLLTPHAAGALASLLDSLPSEVPVCLAGPEIAAQVAGVRFHQGCLALVERPREVPASALIEWADVRLLLLVEDVADPDNIGGLFRNAAAFGVDGVILSPRAADPF